MFQRQLKCFKESINAENDECVAKCEEGVTHYSLLLSTREITHDGMDASSDLIAVKSGN